LTKYDGTLDLLETKAPIGPLAMLRDPHGMGRLVHMIVTARDAGIELDVMRDLPADLAKEIQVRFVNPCSTCDTYLLKDEWVGSAYCSLKCCLGDREHDLQYAEMILQRFEDESGGVVCRKCGTMQAHRPAEARTPVVGGFDEERAKYCCDQCEAKTHAERMP
jgi:hypothetical protein